MPNPKAKELTQEQIEHAEKLRCRGDEWHGHILGWRKVAKIMGVSEASLLMHFDPRALERRRNYGKMWRTSETGDRTFSLVAPSLVPKEVIVERERRLALVHRDTTAVLMGDPLPGMSALDRKQGFRQIGDIASKLVSDLDRRRPVDRVG